MQQRFYCRSYCCSACSGYHYAHHQELKTIIHWLLPVVFRAVVFKLLVWCGAEGYVSGLQDAGLLFCLCSMEQYIIKLYGGMDMLLH